MKDGERTYQEMFSGRNEGVDVRVAVGGGVIAIRGGVDVEGVRARKGFVSGSVGRRSGRGTAVVPTAILDFRLEILYLCLESADVVFEGLEVLLCPRFLCGFLAPGALCATESQEEYARESNSSQPEKRQRKMQARGGRVDAAIARRS